MAKIKAKTLEKALKSLDEETLIAVVNACHQASWGAVSIESTDGFTHPVKTEKSLFNPYASLAILARWKDLETFLRLVYCPDSTVRKMAWQLLCPYHKSISSDFIEDCLLQETTIVSEAPQMDVAHAIAKACGQIKRGTSESTIKRWFDYSYHYRNSKYGLALAWAATYASIGKEIPYQYYEKASRAFYDEKLDEAIIKVLRTRHPSAKLYDHFMEITYNAKIATGIYAGRKDALPHFEPFMQYNAPHMVSTARLVAKAYRGMNISVRHIQELAADLYEMPKYAAMYASIGRHDVPIETIESVLNYCRKGSHRDLQKVAMLAYMNHPKASPMREFKAGRVGYWPDRLGNRAYIKCLNGVIAEVAIPETAHICTTATLGEESHFFYTNEIKVARIIGDFYGEKLGITDKECTWILRRGEHHRLNPITVFDPFEGQGNSGFKIYLDPDCPTT